MENLCGHYDKDLGCLVTFDGSCCKEECFTYRLLLLLQAKEQECKELKKELTSFMNGNYCANGCSLRQQLDKLKTENEELEKELRQKKMTILMNNDHYFEVGQTNKKFKQALQEIKAICNNNDELQGDFNVVDCDKYKLGKHNLANKILQKISECEAENDR